MKKHQRPKAVVAALTFSVVFSLLFKWVQTGNPFSAGTVVFGTVVFLNVLILGGLGFRTYRKFSSQPPAKLKRNLLPVFLLFVFVSLLVALLLVSAGVYAFYLVQGMDTSGFLDQLLNVELIFAVRQFSVWILIGAAFFFYLIWRNAVEREQKLREENLKYKYQNLKSQINPHFLFNSLNTLSELVYEDVKKADRYIQKLSGMYRYILENEEVALVPLTAEINFVNRYFDLQKVRDNDKIRLDIRVEDPDSFQVVPVSLQILVENALKHNARSGKEPLTIQIILDNDALVVSNPVQRKNKLERTSKKGLTNLKERVKLILDKDLTTEEKNNRFVVKLPVIRNQT
jgi:sensor histidine kinase YesM